MPRHAETLLEQIENEALDGSASLAGTLRKCVSLGGRSGSEQLRDWATRELKGYAGDAELPDYRVLAAQLQIDGAVPGGIVKQQPIGKSMLPDFVQEVVDEEVQLRDGVGSLEALVARARQSGEAIKIGLPMSGDIARVMSQETQQGHQILSVYWALTGVAVEGALDQIRTALTVLVAEMRAASPAGVATPTAEAADRAVTFIVSGRRNTMNVTNAFATDEATATVSAAAPERESPFWTRSRRIGAAIVGLFTIAGATAAIAALL